MMLKLAAAGCPRRSVEPDRGISINLHNEVSAVLVGVRQHVGEGREARAAKLHDIETGRPVLNNLNTGTSFTTNVSLPTPVPGPPPLPPK